ncbi:MAG TPA: hypothetical protein VE781_10965 [Kineosporiaceae bacterium]|nr:hypothetical protein [Kineosporiaceae bacterium]
MTPDDPFGLRADDELLATDALLDRVGARAPTPDDLDDPLVAALALMAAEIDLDAVPVESTRAALGRVRPLRAGVEPARPAAPPADEGTGRVLDLRGDAPLDIRPPAARDELRRPRRRPERSVPPSGTGAMAPPRSLARVPTSTGPGGTRGPQGRRERRMRPLLALAVAATAIVLGAGVSAVVTHGRSANPFDGIQEVVAQLSGGRTPDQAAAYDDASRALDRAQAAAAKGQAAKARTELTQAGALLPRLADEDRTAVQQRINEIGKRLGR